MTVSRDATSLKFLPATNAEWTQFLAGLTGSPINPDSVWNLQESASPFADANSVQSLTWNGNTRQAVTGWSRFCAQQTDTTGGNFNSTAGPFGDPYSASHLLFAMIAINATPSATHDVMGIGGGTAFRGVRVTSANKFTAYDLGAGTDTVGTATYGTTVVPVFLQYDRTNAVYRVITSLETINATYNASSTTNLLFTFGAASTTGGPTQILYSAAWRGAKAEMSAATIAAIIGRITTGYVASIALTPTSPSIIVGVTQQLAATATMGDGSTLDVTSAATWAAT